MGLTGSLGVLFLYAYEGDPQAADLDTLNPEKGALIIDTTNGLLHVKSGAAGSNTDGTTPAIRPVALEGKASLTDGATITADTNTARVFQVTIAATGRTLTLTNGKAGRVVQVHVKQDATGSRTITTYTDVLWSGGTLPTLTTTAGRTDVLEFTYNGSKWVGRTVGLNYTI
jgi:hypothetical protein